MDVNCAGAVFIPAVEGSCSALALLSFRLGGTSAAVPEFLGLD